MAESEFKRNQEKILALVGKSFSRRGGPTPTDWQKLGNLISEGKGLLEQSQMYRRLQEQAYERSLKASDLNELLMMGQQITRYGVLASNPRRRKKRNPKRR